MRCSKQGQAWLVLGWAQGAFKEFIGLDYDCSIERGWSPVGTRNTVKEKIKAVGRGLRYTDDTTLLAESEEELKSLLMKVKEECEKTGLKLNILKTKIMASGPIILGTDRNIFIQKLQISADEVWMSEIYNLWSLHSGYEKIPTSFLLPGHRVVCIVNGEATLWVISWE